MRRRGEQESLWSSICPLCFALSYKSSSDGIISCVFNMPGMHMHMHTHWGDMPISLLIWLQIFSTSRWITHVLLIQMWAFSLTYKAVRFLHHLPPIMCLSMYACLSVVFTTGVPKPFPESGNLKIYQRAAGQIQCYNTWNANTVHL